MNEYVTCSKQSNHDDPVEKDIENDDDDDDDESSKNSEDALCELLGIPSLTCVQDEVADEDDENDNNNNNERNIWPCQQKSIKELIINIQNNNHSIIQNLIQQYNLKNEYDNKSICQLPSELSISSDLIRRLTDEIIWGGEKYNNINRTYETIHILKNNNNNNNEIIERNVLTRLENITKYHNGWYELCNIYIKKIISLLFNDEMILYKEKLNIKPCGGSGYAPHIDTPSLRLSLGLDGPQTFITVMIAIDNMTINNGCLRIVKDIWNENNKCDTILPIINGNPDSDGRAGAIPLDIANKLNFENIICDSGTIIIFNGWAPHRSSCNNSNFPRRAIFLTYNPASEGNFYDKYYEKMNELRTNFRTKNQSQNHIDKLELEALNTIPKI